LYGLASDGPVKVKQAENGKDGGTAILGAKNISVENYGFIAGGGGGGGGQGLFHSDVYNAIGGGGTGGGAPFGKASLNEATYSSYKNDPSVTEKVTIPYNGVLYDILISQRNGYAFYTHGTGKKSNIFPAVATNIISDRRVTIELNPEGTAYKTDFSGDRSYQLNLEADGGRRRWFIAYMSTSGTLEVGGLGGSNIVGVPTWQYFVIENGTPGNLYINKGGDGGNIGEPGQDGISTERFGITMEGDTIDHPSAQGGKAGKVFEGDVTINNLGSGITKGR
jgi:hypothetical protein